jgi:hypothetical protein
LSQPPKLKNLKTIAGYLQEAINISEMASTEAQIKNEIERLTGICQLPTSVHRSDFSIFFLDSDN